MSKSILTCGLTLLVAMVAAVVVEGADTAPQWVKVEEGGVGAREGAVLVAVPELKRMLLFGAARKGAFVEAFDPEKKAWEEYAGPPYKFNFESWHDQPAFYYQAAYDPGPKTVFCLSGGDVLYAFDVVAKKWKAYPPAPELDGMAWQTMACDPAGRHLVVVGAEKKGDRLGWSRTVVFDMATEKWQWLEVGDEAIARKHERLVAAKEALVDIIGRIRSAWYRDPKGIGEPSERAAIIKRIGSLEKSDEFSADPKSVHNIAFVLSTSRPLNALGSARRYQFAVEQESEAQYPVPCSRRNSPLVYDSRHEVFVLFGGDHQDYLMNDTWLLDLKTRRWRRAPRDLSPSPRAGHALVYLPESGKIAMYGGYIQSNDTGYAAMPYDLINPAQLWLFDVSTNHWSLAGSWAASAKSDEGGIAPFGYFYGGEGNNRYAPPPLVADEHDRLTLAAPDTRDVYWCRWKRPSQTWTLKVDPQRDDVAGRAEFGAVPNWRLNRVPQFREGFCEVADVLPDTGLDKLPANRWVKLPEAPRNPCHGCRGRDWSTSVWDSDRDQILLWGGGHCVRSSSTVLHYSPVSGRMVEGFDAEESYGGNSPADGTLVFDSTIMGRPWVAVHNYKHYAYDPVSKLLVSGRGYLYDPDRMDWQRREKLPLPYRFDWGATVLASSAHGVVAWARQLKGDDAGLWLFDVKNGWQDLKPQGKLFVPWCDTNGMVYDERRDRMIFTGVGGGYTKKTDGTLLTFDFKTKKLETITPDNIEVGQLMGCLREAAYAAHADWVLLGSNLVVGDPATGKSYTRVYDCAANRMGLLDAGRAPDGHEAGWMYDARRKLVYAFTTHAEAYALRIVSSEAHLLDKAE